MATTFNWTVTAMDCRANEGGKTDVVFNVHWTCSGVDGDHSASIYSTCAVPAPGDSFTPYGQLTQQQVLDWVWANGVDKDATEAAVGQRIANVKNPPVVTPALPWSV